MTIDLFLLANGTGAAGGGGSFPPFHPILVNFTAGLIPASFAFDLLGAWLKKDALRAAGWWTLLLAACLTPLTALAGWLWMRSMGDMGHWQMPIHMWTGISLAVLFILMAAWRGWLYYRAGRTPGWGYGIAAAVLLGALMYQGDLGGSMSFGRGIVISAGEEGGHSHGDESDQHGGEKAGAHGPSTEPATQPAGGDDHSGREHSGSHSH